jgi:hydroxyethylthiazole kinase-like uncharacterized protein yjeF
MHAIRLSREKSGILSLGGSSQRFQYSVGMQSCLAKRYLRRQHCSTLFRKTVLFVTTTTAVFSRMASAASISLSGTCGGMKYLGQQEAQALDLELFETFSVDTLMELAGLSVAEAVHEVFPPSTHPKILIVAGPGNNGGDGLVVARHLFQFNYSDVRVHYPKQSKKELFLNLVQQNEACGNTFLPDMPSADEMDEMYDVVIDSIFGFSFKVGAGIRSPFDNILEQLSKVKKTNLVSVDIPSGWDVELGPPKPNSSPPVPLLSPAMLVSLTAPKLCAKSFGNVHYLGGRFVPPGIAKKYGIDGLPPYKGSRQSLNITAADSKM